MSDNGQGLTLDQILGADDLEIERVDTPAWGGHVYVRTISGNQRDRFDQLFSSRADGEEINLVGVRARLVAMCLCDGKGASLKPTEAQITALGTKSSAMLDRCFEVCQRINGMRDADIEKLEKNSQATELTDSG